MAESRKYGKTLVACYLGFITQAIAANFAPLLFVSAARLSQISLKKSCPAVLRKVSSAKAENLVCA